VKLWLVLWYLLQPTPQPMSTTVPPASKSARKLLIISGPVRDQIMLEFVMKEFKNFI
jgi:hypothetical protein